MPFELVREYMTIDQEVSTFNTQTSLEELIKIPDYKPNMRNVLFVKGVANITSQSLEENILNVEGEADYKVYYIAEGGYLECTQVLVPYDYSMELKNLKGDINCILKSNFEHIDYRITNSRKINIRSILHIEGRVVKKNHFPILTDVKELKNIEKLQDKIIITKSAIKNKERISITDAFVTEESDETSLKYIDASVRLAELKSSKSPSGVLLSGKAEIQALYAVEYEEKKEYKHIEEVVNFTHFIEKTDIDNIDNYFFQPSITYQKFDFSTDEIKQQIVLNAEIIVDTNIILYENIQIENIQDLYSPMVETEIEKEEVQAYYVVEDFGESISVSDEIIISADYPLEQILVVDMGVVVTDIMRQGKYIQVQGIVESTVIVKIASEIDVLEKFQKEIPFTYNVHTSTENNQIADFSVALQGGNVTQRGNSIMISQDVLVKGNLYQSIKLNMIQAITEVEVQDQLEIGEYYSIKAYYKQPGDSLWDIAKTNSTTIDKILKDNYIEGVENIADYTPLVIIK
ncbi:MAG: DUF3794 and LysM peptidoglycan-binding domain-containing protein [Eubacteriales bacterium]